jgi:hypothetical protein
MEKEHPLVLMFALKQFLGCSKWGKDQEYRIQYDEQRIFSNDSRYQLMQMEYFAYAPLELMVSKDRTRYVCINQLDDRCIVLDPVPERCLDSKTNKKLPALSPKVANLLSTSVVASIRKIETLVGQNALHIDRTRVSSTDHYPCATCKRKHPITVCDGVVTCLEPVVVVAADEKKSVKGKQMKKFFSSNM